MNIIAKSLRKPLKSILLALQPPAQDCPWKVDREELGGVSIRWPRELEWKYAVGWVEPLLRGFGTHVPVKATDIPQRLKGCVIIEFCRSTRVYRVGINCSDYPDVAHFGTPGAALDFEFKMQYRNGGYDEPHIVPGGYISDFMLVDWYAARARRERDRQQFQWDVYGRFGMQFATEVRSKAIKILEEQTRVGFYGGARKVRFPKFLREIARSRVCLDLPGNGPLCFRLVNYLAVGACIVSVPHSATLPVPLIDRQHIVYTKPDMSDLVELCETYVNDRAARESIMRQSREYYRRHLYWRSLSNYYLRTMLDRLP